MSFFFSLTALFLLASPFQGEVIRIVDGDTIAVVTASKEEIKIRLANIDAPENKQPHGRTSRRALLNLIWKKRVEIRPLSKDKYGRTVALLLLDGVDISAVMVIKGMA